MKKIIFIITLMISLYILIFKITFAAPVLLIDKVNINPGVAIPGKNFFIEFYLKNNTNRRIDNIVLKAKQLEGKNTLSGFSPVGTNQSYLNSIDPSSEGVIRLEMIVDSQLKTGVYNIEVLLSYNEKDLDTIEETRLIGVVVNRPANLLITDIDVSNKKELKFTAVNASSARIADAVVYTYFGELEKIKYLGVLEANDENEIVESIPENIPEGNIKIKIVYKDELNKDYVIEKDVTIEQKNDESVSEIGYRSNIWFFVKKIFGIGI